MEKQVFFNETKAHFNLRRRASVKPTNIYFVVNLNGRQIKFATGVKVYPDHWNDKKEEAILSYRLAELDYQNNLMTNAVLGEMMSRFNHFKEFICSHPEKVINCEPILKQYIFKTDMADQNKSESEIYVDIIATLYSEVEKDTLNTDGSRNNKTKKFFIIIAF